MNRSKAKSGTLPWWLAEDEKCSSCEHPYAQRTEIYCFDCDAPVCPICIEQTVSLELICPSCAQGRDKEGAA